MWLRRVTGGSLLCLVLTGCTGSEAPPPDRGTESRPAVGALGEWQPPAGAPEFCSVLAAADHVDDIPDAVGLLQADPADTQQAYRLTQGSGDLQDVRAAVRRGSGHADLAEALDDVVDALTLAASGSPDEATTERIADGLAAVGRYAQPACEFPT